MRVHSDLSFSCTCTHALMVLVMMARLRLGVASGVTKVCEKR